MLSFRQLFSSLALQLPLWVSANCFSLIFSGRAFLRMLMCVEVRSSISFGGIRAEFGKTGG